MPSLAPPSADPGSRGAKSRGPLVLIIEDTTDLRDLFAAELATDGFLVIDAVDGEAGIDKAKQFEPDAIVLDLMLPGINGFNVARILRGLRTHAKRRHRRGYCAVVGPSADAGDRSRVRLVSPQARPRSRRRAGVDAPPRRQA